MATVNTWSNRIDNAAITLNSTTNAINISSDASATVINICTGGGAKAITVGSTNTTSSLALQYGTSDFTVASASGTVMSALDTGEITKPLQPAFLAYLGATVLNKTGNGTNYILGTDALTEVYDQGSDFDVGGTFTAPVSGIYKMCASIGITGCTAATTFIMSINIVGQQSCKTTWTRQGSNEDACVASSSSCEMDAADTAYCVAQIQGEGADTDDIYGAARGSYPSYFCGHLVC